MHNKVFFIAIILLLILAGLACNKADNDYSLPPSNQTPPVFNPNNPIDSQDPLMDRIGQMSLQEKVGQLVMVGIEGYNIDAQVQNMITEDHVGGLILFKQNVKDLQQMLGLIQTLKESNSANQIPLFLSVDEEGGRISRMPADFMKLPSNQEIGQLNDGMLSYQIGQIIGDELRMLGFNMNFAPVLDINSNPDNPVIGDRAFGTHADVVSKLGVETMKGLQSQNIISVVKHFPGHGDTSVDSHIGLPTINHDMDRLNSFELQPFAEAIKNGADAIMIAHILLPQIDPDHPSTFSKIIISDILRRDLQFDGLVITDDMTMGAITENYDIGQAAVQSINAGSDIILVCHDYDKEAAVIEALLEAAQNGTITPERLDESVYRILALKEKYALDDRPVSSVKPEDINKKIQALFNDYSL
jgi:beta-N-acetylhexosaminidase